MPDPRHFLFAMWDGGGNVPPVMGLTKRLIARGHQVTVLGDPTLADEVCQAGATLMAWTTAPHRKSRRPQDDVIKDYEIKNPLKMIRTYIDEFVGKPAPRWAADTLAALQTSRADVLIADIAIPAAMIAGEKLGIPVTGFVPNIWMLPTPGIPPLGPGFAPARGPLGWTRDWLMRKLTSAAFSPATPYLNAVRAAYGLPPVNSTHEQMLRADEIFVLTSPRFDFTSPAMSANVRYGGPILDDPDWCEPWQSPWAADDKRPLVLVGLSSTFQDQSQTMRHIVEALSRLPVRALLTLGQTIDATEVPAAANVVVVNSAPHAQVLPHTSVLITHCGHGTTMRGLAAGVPLVCMPMGRDQNDTAARVVHHGAGVRLSPKSSAAQIERAVTRVLEDPAYGRAAQRMATAINSREGCVDVIESLERLAMEANVQATQPALV